jgi:hypothetical protein
MLHVRPVLGVLIAATVLAAGCGSSSSDEATSAVTTAPAAAVAAPTAATPAPTATASTTGPAPSKATYVRRADRVCREARGLSQRANAVVQQAFAAQQSVAAANAIDRYLPLFAEQVQTLKELRQPLRDRKILKGLLKVMDGQVTALVAESKALRDEDDATLQQIGVAQQQEQAFAEELGKQYGFMVCGRAA